jgi:glucose/arabinose dehydrogenase
MRYDRREMLRVLTLSGAAGLAGCVTPGDQSGTTTQPPGTSTVRQGDDDFTIALEKVGEGLVSPTNLVVAPHDGTRYVMDQVGTVHRLGRDGLADEPFLDLRDRVLVSPERGLLGMAFHPNFPDDPRFFLRYSAPRRPGTPNDYSHTEVLAEIETTEDGTEPRMETERSLIEFPSPTIFHQAGTILFGPDGYLYITMGEGTKKPFAQDVESNLLGGIHRIDVDSETDEKPYGIPSDNPLKREDGRDEYFAWGLRNPWRMSFNNGRLIVGDVGEFRYEEIDIVEKGNNYGWPYREGAHCVGWNESDTSGPMCGVDPDSVPGEEFVDPVLEFPHDGDRELVGTAVIAGYTYDRDDIPGIKDRYIFSNYTRTLKKPRGELFAANPTDDAMWSTEKLSIENGPNGEVHRVINSMGRDADGRLYLLAVSVPDTSNRFDERAGEVYRIVPEGAGSGQLPAT